MTVTRTRLAPTPSGYLHAGNLANFLLIEKMAKEEGGIVILRIDDCDGTRARPEFVEHIFETLNWLGIRWSEGPRDAADFYRGFSQVARRDLYFARLAALKGRTYACACSRKEIDGVYPGTCRDKGIEFVPGKTALRLRIDEPGLRAVFGDVVLWRKDDGPAYQWVSVIDDLDAHVTLIVRGEDLRDSSRLQRHVADLVSPGAFAGVRFVHHPLLLDDEGRKLAKSGGAASVNELRAAGMTPESLRADLSAIIAGWSKTGPL